MKEIFKKTCNAATCYYVLMILKITLENDLFFRRTNRDSNTVIPFCHEAGQHRLYPFDMTFILEKLKKKIYRNFS